MKPKLQPLSIALAFSLGGLLGLFAGEGPVAAGDKDCKASCECQGKCEAKLATCNDACEKSDNKTKCLIKCNDKLMKCLAKCPDPDCTCGGY